MKQIIISMVLLSSSIPCVAMQQNPPAFILQPQSLKQICIDTIVCPPDTISYKILSLPLELQESIEATACQKINEIMKKDLHNIDMHQLATLLKNYKPKKPIINPLMNAITQWQPENSIDILRTYLALLLQYNLIYKEDLARSLQIIIEREARTGRAIFFDAAECIIEQGFQKDLSRYKFNLFSFPVVFCKRRNTPRCKQFIEKIIAYKVPQKIKDAGLKRAVEQVVLWRNEHFLDIMEILLRHGADITTLPEDLQQQLHTFKNRS